MERNFLRGETPGRPKLPHDLLFVAWVSMWLISAGVILTLLLVLLGAKSLGLF